MTHTHSHHQHRIKVFKAKSSNTETHTHVFFHSLADDLMTLTLNDMQWLLLQSCAEVDVVKAAMCASSAIGVNFGSTYPSRCFYVVIFLFLPLTQHAEQVSRAVSWVFCRVLLDDENNAGEKIFLCVRLHEVHNCILMCIPFTCVSFYYV